MDEKKSVTKLEAFQNILIVIALFHTLLYILIVGTKIPSFYETGKLQLNFLNISLNSSFEIDYPLLALLLKSLNILEWAGVTFLVFLNKKKKKAATSQKISEEKQVSQQEINSENVEVKNKILDESKSAAVPAGSPTSVIANPKASQENEVNKNENNDPKKGIKTDIDSLYELIKEKKKLPISQLPALFNADKKVIIEWCNILENANLVKIIYPRFQGPMVEIVEGVHDETQN